MLNTSWSSSASLNTHSCLLQIHVNTEENKMHPPPLILCILSFTILLPGCVKMEGSQKTPPCFTSKCLQPSTSDCQQCHGTPERQTLLRTAESHGLQLLNALRSFREHNLMFDFTINVAGHAFPCHRCVLAACSDFFRYSVSFYIWDGIVLAWWSCQCSANCIFSSIFSTIIIIDDNWWLNLFFSWSFGNLSLISLFGVLGK